MRDIIKNTEVVKNGDQKDKNRCEIRLSAFFFVPSDWKAAQIHHD